MDVNDFISQVKYRLSIYDNGRRSFLENEVISSNILFAINFINKYKLSTATQQMIDEAVLELSVHRCLVIFPSRLPNLKSAWDDIIEQHKSILLMALKGVIPDDVISQILDDQTSSDNIGNANIPMPVVGRTHSMIYDYFNYNYTGRL